MISIVIPIYNVEKFLPHCLDSVMNQTYKNWECILVNDGSQDGSGDICDKFARVDHRFKVIHKPNEGVSRARNQGIDAAKGEFLTFIDSDDVISKDYLKAFMDCNPQKDSITVQGVITKTLTREFVSYSYPDVNGIRIDNASKYIVDFDIFQDGGPVNKLYYLDLINRYNIRFNPDLSYHEDHLFVYDYYLHCKKINLSSNLGYYYMHYGEWSANSLSKFGKKNYKGLITASLAFHEILPQVFDYYNITDDRYIRKVYTRTGYSQILLAIQCLYSDKSIDDSVKYKILKSHIGKVRNFRFKYSPITPKRFLMLVTLSLPNIIAHYILIKTFALSHE